MPDILTATPQGHNTLLCPPAMLCLFTLWASACIHSFTHSLIHSFQVFVPVVQGPHARHPHRHTSRSKHPAMPFCIIVFVHTAVISFCLSSLTQSVCFHLWFMVDMPNILVTTLQGQSAAVPFCTIPTITL